MDAQRVLRPADRCARHLHHLAVQLAHVLRTPATMPRTMFAPMS